MWAGRPSFAVRAADAVSAAVIIPAVGIAVACVGATIVACCDLVWTDLLHVNPYRSSSNVWATMRLSPAFGLFAGLMLLGLPVASGGLLAALATLLWRRPSAAGMAGVSAASVILFVRWCYAGAEAAAETPDWRLDSPPWTTLLGGAALLTASLYAGWGVHGRTAIGEERPDGTVP